MKKILSICSLTLMMSTVYASEIDYKHCIGAVNSLRGIASQFMEMDSEGKIKITRKSPSMKTEGDSVVYTDMNLETTTEKMASGTKLIKAKELTDVETFKIRYEKVENGQPQGKIVGIDYKVEDKQYKGGGQLSMDFSYKNGHCVPNTTKKSIFAPKGKVGSFFVKALESVVPTIRHWDINKCKELHEYVEANKDLEACLTSAPKLAKLETILRDLTDTKEPSEKKQKKSLEKSESELKKTFVIYSAAKLYMDGCKESGYQDILADKAYWEAIKETPVTTEDTASISK